METAANFTEEIKARVPRKLKRLVGRVARQRMISESALVREALAFKFRRDLVNARRAA